MKATKETILYGIIGLLTGSLLTMVVATAAVNNHNNGMMNMMGMHTDGNDHGNTQNMNDTNMPGMDHGGMQ